MFAEREPRHKEKKVEHITYPWTLEDDMKTTDDNLKTAEKIVGKQLSLDAVKNGGMDMISFYDNNKRVFERNTPYGNHWWKPQDGK